MSDFSDKSYRERYRHTSSHILAHAVKRLYPETKLAIGPAIEDGFYYDFDRPEPFTPDDLTNLEAEMKKIIRERLPVEQFILPRAKARQDLADAGEIYKVELVDDLPDEAEISFYRQGDFVDLCQGPHLDNTGQVKAIKLTQVAGAYWRGNEKNKMLQRIYGTSFPDKAQLNAYLEQLAEAKKRDHNKLGRELEFFTTTDYIGQGLPIILPKGTRVLQTLQRFVEDEEEKRGYLFTRTPLMAKSDLYRISGHWDHYRDGMFIIGDADKADTEEVLALRPMTCPFQFQAYLTRTRSYRDLPLRYAETSTLFRNEASGEMHGLIRLRQFTISEGHIVCTPGQLDAEFRGALDLASFMLKALGMDQDVTYRFSTWDPADRDKYIGSPDQWDEVQATMQQILDSTELAYEHGFGEAAFYGPKLDIQIKNVFGKEDTLITIQIDFQLAERFGMLYTDKDGNRRHPIIIHRTSVGCYERTLALLIEKYAGALPLWMAPEHARILPIAERHVKVAREMARTMQEAGLRVSVDERDERIGKKIRDGRLERLQYLLTLGDKEQEEGSLAVRSRLDGDLGTMALPDLISRLEKEIKERRIS